METKHTPGPWRAEFEGSRGFRIVHLDNVGLPLGYFSGLDAHDPVNKANARLIAAAPDLLVAAQDLLALLGAGPSIEETDSDSECERIRIAALRAAITKAGGR